MSPHTDAGALLKLAQAALEYIDAIPKDIVLPAMPGFDRDWANEVIARQAASHGSEGGEKQASDAPVWYAHAEAHAWADGYNAALSPPVKAETTDPLYDSRNPNHGRTGGLADPAQEAKHCGGQSHDSRVYFMCESCEEHNPEGAVGPRSDIAVMPDGTWLCDGCYSDCDKSAYGLIASDVDDFVFPRFEDLPRPAPYGAPSVPSASRGTEA